MAEHGTLGLGLGHDAGVLGRRPHRALCSAESVFPPSLPLHSPAPGARDGHRYVTAFCDPLLGVCGQDPRPASSGQGAAKALRCPSRESAVFCGNAQGTWELK